MKTSLMNKLIGASCCALMLAAQTAGAWDTHYDFWVSNQSCNSDSVYITATFNNQSGSGSETEAYGPFSVAGGRMQEFTGSGGWPVNTLPGSSVTGMDAQGYCSGGGSENWPNGSTTIYITGNFTIGTNCPTQTTSTNVTITLTNNTSGYADLTWTYDGSIQQMDLRTCPGTSDSSTATIHYNADGGALDTFSGNVSYDGPSLTNHTVTLTNPDGSGVVMDFSWIFNGQYAYVDHNMMPGSSDSHSANVNLCAGDTFTGQTTATGPAYTNVTGTVSNPFTDKTVLAYWTFNGQTVKQETLLPGQSDSVTEQIPMGGANTTFAWGYTVNGNFGGNSDNPFGTNNIGMSYSNSPSGGSGGFGGTGGGGTSGATGGGTGTGGTVGGSTPTGTNAPIWTGNIFTNNINYPDPPGGGNGTDTKGLALDSTLRAIGGTLHNDNLETLKGLGVIDKDVQSVTQAILGKGTNIITVNVPANSNIWVQNFPSMGPVTNLLGSIDTYALGTQTAMGVMTNEAGQQISYLAILTNDVWQIVKEMTNQPAFADTNGYLGGLYTNSIDLNTKFGTFTNDAGQQVAYEAVLSNDLWIITQELTNMAGTLTQQVIVNFPTNMTYTFNQASNVNVMNWPTNYATENTLEGISNLLASGLIGSNGNFTLDTNFGAYLNATSDLAGYSVAYDGPTTYDATVSASGAAADQSGLTTQETAFDTLVANITDFSGNVLDTYPPVDMTFDFGPYVSGSTAKALGFSPKANGLSGASGTMMDFDPLHSTWGPELFSVAKQLFTWLIALAFFVRVTEEAWKAVMVITGAHGINPQAVRTVIKNTGTSGLPGNPNV